MRQHGRLPCNSQEKFEIMLKHELQQLEDKYVAELKEKDEIIARQAEEIEALQEELSLI